MLEIKKKKNTSLATRNFFNGLISRLDPAEGRIKEVEDKSTEMINIETKQKKGGERKAEQSSQERWDAIN